MSGMIERQDETGMTNAQPQRAAGSEMTVARVAAEVQAAMVIARKFPRDEVKARARIASACSRVALATDAVYEFPRGAEKVTGPSIRLLEVVAQNWGNLDFGFVEVERRPGSSTVMAYSWDLETNTRSTKVFDVPHKRDTKRGSYALTDDRDIYERVANDAARRVRSCLEAVIPGDVLEEAVAKCHRTLVGDSTVPLVDQIAAVVTSYERIGVTVAMIEAKLGHAIGATTPHELARLKRWGASIRDKVVKVEEVFEVETVDANAKPAAGTTTANAKTLDEYAAAANAEKADAKPTATNEPKGDAKAAAKSAATSDAKPEGKGPDLFGDLCKALAACQTVAAVEDLAIPTGLSKQERARVVDLIDAKVKALNAAGGAK